mmetsp:Transcript_15032/g.33064  ORF Transcript_15032/g.33064 Transcript_15032/m.33064 type:complete len:143 (-) Transcript_15032:753-1181(-)
MADVGSWVATLRIRPRSQYGFTHECGPSLAESNTRSVFVMMELLGHGGAMAMVSVRNLLEKMTLPALPRSRAFLAVWIQWPAVPTTQYFVRAELSGAVAEVLRANWAGTECYLSARWGRLPCRSCPTRQHRKLSAARTTRSY